MTTLIHNNLIFVYPVIGEKYFLMYYLFVLPNSFNGDVIPIWKDREINYMELQSGSLE